MKCWTQILYHVHIILLFISYLITSHDCVDVDAQKENYVPDYSIYNNVSMLRTQLKNLENKYPDYIKLSDEYVSRNGESQLFTRVSNFSLNLEKEDHRIRVFFAFGEHAREFFPVESLLYFLKRLTSGTVCTRVQGSCQETSDASSVFSTWVLSNFDFYIIAMTNPDGRIYLEKTENYCWRGTALGVDLNRNFDWSFGQMGSSSNPKDDEFRGPHAFSEPETKIFKQITQDIAIDAFVSFHSGIRHIYIPFADSVSKKTHRVPYNLDCMKELAKRMSTTSPLRPFRYGVASELTGYFADGTSFDFMSGAKKIPFSFAIELWQHRRHRGRSCFDEFNPHSKTLERELALVHPLYVEFLSFLHQWKTGAITDSCPKLQVDPMQKRLARFKKDELHQRRPNDKMSESMEDTIKESATQPGQLKMLLAVTIVLILIYVMIKHILNVIRKKRVVNLRSLSSTFSMLKNL